MFGKDKIIEDLKKQIQSMESDNEFLSKSNEDLLNTVHAFAETEANYKKEISELKKSLKTINEKHQTELDITKKSVNRQVNTTLAAIGVSQFANEQFTVDSNQSDMEVFNTFQSLTGTEKTEYYNKNKAKITRVLLSKS